MKGRFAPDAIAVSLIKAVEFDDTGVPALYRNVQWFRGGLVFETLASLSLRLKDLVGTAP